MFKKLISPLIIAVLAGCTFNVNQPSLTADTAIHGTANTQVSVPTTPASAVATPSASPTESEPSVPPTPEPTPAPAVFKGSGSKTGLGPIAFRIKSASYEAANISEGTLEFRLVKVENGERVGEPVQFTKLTRGASAFGGQELPAPGEYLLDVTASGDWEIEFKGATL